MQPKSPTNAKGIDVSHYETVTDWNAVKSSGISFVYCKATEGTTMQDDTFTAKVQGARAAGLLTGAYHFAHPEANDVKGEINNFLTAWHAAPTDLIPVLDLEAPTDPSKISTHDLIVWAGAFVNGVRAVTGTNVMIYTGKWFTDMYQGLWNAFINYPLWISNYSNVTAPPDCCGWTRWAMWQYTDQGVVPGITGNVDMNVCEDLAALEIKKPLYPDVPLGYWAEGSIAVAVSQGFMSAFDDGTFKPDSPLTRAQAAKIINELIYKFGSHT